MPLINFTQVKEQTILQNLKESSLIKKILPLAEELGKKMKDILKPEEKEKHIIESQNKTSTTKQLGKSPRNSTLKRSGRLGYP